MHKYRLRTIVLLFCIGVSLIAVALSYRALGTFEVPLAEALTGDEAGALVSVHRTGHYPQFAVQAMINAAPLQEPITVASGVSTYRVQYRTTNHDGKIVVASGLLALPRSKNLSGVVSYHHGTNSQRATAPSQPGLGEGLFMAAAVGGRGKVLLAPDYIGLGESRDVHPYLYTETTVETCADFLKAAHAFVKQEREHWPDKLFLLGFSQGGHATMALHQALEARNDPRFQVTASAPCAGAFDMKGISFPQALTGETDSHALYLAYVANAYAHIYAQPIASILRDPYADTVPVLFDGDHTVEEVFDGMPDTPRGLFTAAFMNAYDQGEPHWFIDAYTENGLAPWEAQAPIHLYYGEDDVDVLPEEAKRMAKAMKALGADAKALSVGPYAHDESALHALPAALKWFEAYH